MPNQKFTRKEFYNLVWSKPVSKIAAELKVKDALVRKICKRFDIPLPKAGYWKKLEYKKPVSVEKLSEDAKWKKALIDIDSFDSEYKDEYQYKLAQRVKEIEVQLSKEVAIRHRLTNPNPLVQRAKSYLDKQSPSKWRGFEDTIRTNGGLLSISVAKNNISRMLRFIDSFIKLLEKRGHKIEIRNWDTQAIVNEESFTIKFREKCNRKVIEEGKWNRHELVPNGRLSVKIVFSLRTYEWIDGRKTIEQQLSKIVASLELKAEQEKLDRAEREKRWAEQKRLQAIRDQHKIRAQQEKRRIEMLLDHSSKWRVAQDLHLFIAGIESTNEEKGYSPSVREWIDWAKAVQKSIDPISGDVEKYIELYKMNTDK